MTKSELQAEVARLQAEVTRLAVENGVLHDQITHLYASMQVQTQALIDTTLARAAEIVQATIPQVIDAPTIIEPQDTFPEDDADWSDYGIPPGAMPQPGDFGQGGTRIVGDDVLSPGADMGDGGV